MAWILATLVWLSLGIWGSVVTLVSSSFAVWPHSQRTACSFKSAFGWAQSVYCLSFGPGDHFRWSTQKIMSHDAWSHDPVSSRKHAWLTSTWLIRHARWYLHRTPKLPVNCSSNRLHKSFDSCLLHTICFNYSTRSGLHVFGSGLGSFSGEFFKKRYISLRSQLQNYNYNFKSLSPVILRLDFCGTLKAICTGSFFYSYNCVRRS